MMWTTTIYDPCIILSNMWKKLFFIPIPFFIRIFFYYNIHHHNSFFVIIKTRIGVVFLNNVVWLLSLVFVVSIIHVNVIFFIISWSLISIRTFGKKITNLFGFKTSYVHLTFLFTFISWQSSYKECFTFIGFTFRFRFTFLFTFLHFFELMVSSEYLNVFPNITIQLS